MTHKALGMTKYFRNYEGWLALITKHSNTTGKETTNNNKYEFYVELKTLNMFQRTSNAIHTEQYKNCNLWRRALDLITKHSRTTGKETPNNNKYEFYSKLKTLNLLRGTSNAYVWNDTKTTTSDLSLR